MLSYTFDVDYELIFIDDGSKDNTLNSIKELADYDDFVKYISFSRCEGNDPGLMITLLFMIHLNSVTL